MREKIRNEILNHEKIENEIIILQNKMMIQNESEKNDEMKKAKIKNENESENENLKNEKNEV
jgi:hypothetical protein